MSHYHSSSGFWGGGMGDKRSLSLSSFSNSFCGCVSLFLSMIFWVKSTRYRASVSSSDEIQQMRNNWATVLGKHKIAGNSNSTDLESLLLSSAHRAWLFPPTSACVLEQKVIRCCGYPFLDTVNIRLINSPGCIKADLLLGQLLCIFRSSCWNSSILFAPDIRFLKWKAASKKSICVIIRHLSSKLELYLVGCGFSFDASIRRILPKFVPLELFLFPVQFSLQVY